jgi:uncharacterized protein YutE (UPF0331/DUF86 family)
MNDVVTNKAASIQRCVKRAREELAAAEDFDSDYTRQDAAILNVTRACEQTIDLANYVVRTKKLGVPTDSGESFDLLAAERIVDRALADKLKRMTGFRNTVVHQYQEIDLSIVRSVIDSGLNDLLAFVDLVIEAEKDTE